MVNPDPSINYEQFKEKFFFPDHAVFFPYPISSSEIAQSNMTVSTFTLILY